MCSAAVAGASGNPAGSGPWVSEAAAPVAVFEAEGAAVNGKLYVFGGFDNPKIQVTSSAEVYDPATNAWQVLPNAPAPQTHVGTATDGRIIYFAGGFRGNWYGQASSDFWEYDTVAHTWTRGPSLPAARGAGGLVLLGRQLHFFGGAYGPNPSHVSDASNHWVLNLDKLSAGWVAKAPLPDPRNHFGYAALGGKVYAIGGQHRLNEAKGLDATVSVYDPVTDAWSSAAPLPSPRSHLHNSTFVYAGRIICVGGTDTGDVASDQILAFDPTANAWSVVGSLPEARSAAVAQAVGGEIVVATGTPTGVVPQADVWARPLDFFRPLVTAAPVPDAAPMPPAPILGSSGSTGALTVRIATPAPSAVVTGRTRREKGSANIRVVNSGAGRIAGPVAVILYLVPGPSADPAGDPAAVPVASVTRHLVLRGGAGKVLHIALRYPANLASGVYFLEARVTAAGAGSAALVVSPTPVSVAGPFVFVTGSFASPLPAALTPGRRVTASLVVKNTGNVPAVGLLRIALSAVGPAAASGSGSATATPVATLTRKATLPPGRSKLLKLRIVLPRSLAAGTYSLAASLNPAG